MGMISKFRKNRRIKQIEEVNYKDPPPTKSGTHSSTKVQRLYGKLTQKTYLKHSQICTIDV